MKKLNCLLFGFALLVASGCGGGDKDDDKSKKDSDDKNKQSNVEKNDVNVVQANQSTDEKSPATNGAESHLTLETPPGEICTRFLAAIRKGDNISWERLLTKSAHNLIRSARVELEYPGGPRASCSVTNVQYNNSAKSIALVQCLVQEPVDGKTESSEFSYLLRKKKMGWRIVGIMIPTDDQGGMDFLSFENSNDVAKIKSFSGNSATSVASDPGQTQLK